MGLFICKNANISKIMSAILVFLGGGLGSLVRYGIGFAFPYSNGFPWATFIANILACLILGLTLGWIDRTNSGTFIVDHTKWFLITGFCGGFSTFSTFSNETFQLLKQQEWGLAILYIVLSLVLGILTLIIGFKLHL